MGKETPTAAIIAARTIGGVNFASTAQKHIMLGDKTDGTGAHSGLHSLNLAAGKYTGMTLADEVRDARVESIFSASVTLKGGKTAKTSTFFPATMNWDQVKAAITEAWEDCQIYSDNNIYIKMKAKYGLQMIGLATIKGQKIWIGSTKSGKSGSGIETAFPAVNNKFS